MSDKEIIHKYVDLDKLWLTDEEKKHVMDMLYKYKDKFSLRDEIGTCPNIEVYGTDNLHFSLDHMSLKKKTKRF